MEAWDIIVIGDGPAALRASAVAAKEKASTLMMSSQSLGIGDTTALDGIAAPLKESTTKSHRDDTIRAGGFLCDQDIVSQRITCLLYTSPSPRDDELSRMPSSA